MSNHRLGLMGACTVCAATASFAVFMLLPGGALPFMLSCGASIFIAFGYICLAAGLAAYAEPEKKACAFTAVAFAGVYAVFVTFVYYTQLTTVWQQAAPQDLLTEITYRPGSWFFNLDLFGYGLLSLSTVFAGLAVTAKTRGETWLRRLLMIHGLFAVSCFAFPVLGLFSRDAEGASSDLYGVLALECWCLYFLPVTLLAADFFKRRGREAAAAGKHA